MQPTAFLHPIGSREHLDTFKEFVAFLQLQGITKYVFGDLHLELSKPELPVAPRRMATQEELAEQARLEYERTLFFSSGGVR